MDDRADLAGAEVGKVGTGMRTDEDGAVLAGQHAVALGAAACAAAEFGFVVAKVKAAVYIGSLDPDAAELIAVLGGFVGGGGRSDLVSTLLLGFFLSAGGFLGGRLGSGFTLGCGLGRARGNVAFGLLVRTLGIGGNDQQNSCCHAYSQCQAADQQAALQPSLLCFAHGCSPVRSGWPGRRRGRSGTNRRRGYPAEPSAESP